MIKPGGVPLLVTTAERQVRLLAFYRTKRVNGREYRQLAENYRGEGGVHRQRVLAHLGGFETVEEAARVL